LAASVLVVICLFLIFSYYALDDGGDIELALGVDIFELLIGWL
jgi:hypothetical protein